MFVPTTTGKLVKVIQFGGLKLKLCWTAKAVVGVGQDKIILSPVTGVMPSVEDGMPKEKMLTWEP